MNKTILLITCIAVPGIAQAQTVEATWTVQKFVGDAAFLDPAELIGKTQTLDSGFAEGVFYVCDLAGQYMSYTRHSLDDFLALPAFAEFQSVSDEMRAAGTTVYVHTISCNGDGSPGSRQKLTPFVTVDDATSAWYPFEGGVFTLEMSN